MAYKSLADCLHDLEKSGQLKRISRQVDPNLEMADIHLETFARKGPALLFENVKGSPFPAASNIYGTKERTEYIFRKEIPRMKEIMAVKGNPMMVLKHPLRFRKVPFTALNALPKKSFFKPPILHGRTSIDRLPQIISWPDDGGAFITLPQVMTLPPGSTNPMHANIGMYRIQMSGNDYIPNQEIGLHYQLHRGIGVHHAMYNESQEAFKVSIFVGGPPAHTFAAIMPLPEGLSEMTFAGMLNNRRFRYYWHKGFLLSSDADFVITGYIQKNKLKKEGPFGDHIGYYSLAHDFPVMQVEDVYHRKDAIWHFTVVGRPPQEDSYFGHLIHLLAGDILGSEFPGIREVHAVDEAGVHPLLLAIGSERYMPFERIGRTYQAERPEEILTQAQHLLGKGQTSLAKFLLIADGTHHPQLSAHDVNGFLRHLLERIDWKRDLHFLTNTTIDTLDYSGSGWNMGSKVIMACAGKPKRQLSAHLPSLSLPEGFSHPQVAMPGVVIITGPKYQDHHQGKKDMLNLSLAISPKLVDTHPLIVVADKSDFTAKNLANFLWVTFTRADPAQDIHGVDSFTKDKHWGCQGPLIIDARIKPHHAPELIRKSSLSSD